LLPLCLLVRRVHPFVVTLRRLKDAHNSVQPA
jgi:hypothetical protein